MEHLPDSIATTTLEAMRALVELGGTPGVAVAIVRGGRAAGSWAMGAADPFTGRATTTDTLFRIASVTKPFTATAVLQLRDAGCLALHDPLVKHLPEAARITDPFGVLDRISISHLLLHTAGLQADAPVVDPRAAPAVRHALLLERLHLLRLVRPPDTHWHYSNVGYELLAMMVERMAGRPYAERLAETVTGPAGLRDTTFHPVAGQLDRMAVGVLPGGRDGDWTRAPDHDSDAHLGDGGLWSTVDDLARWITVNCLTAATDRRGDGPRILDGPSLREIQRPMVLVDLDGWRSAQGLGWASFRIDEDLWQGHTGSIAGLRSIVLLRASDGLGVVALTNGSERPNPVAFAACRALLADHRSRPGPMAAVSDAGAGSGQGPGPGAEAAAAPDGGSGPGRGPIGRWQDAAFGRTLTVATGADAALVLVETGLAPVGLVVDEESGMWRIGGDEGRTGELVRHTPADATGLETLSVAGWPFHRAAG